MSTTADTSRADASTIRTATLDDADRIFSLLKQLGSTYAPDRVAFDESLVFLIEDEATSALLIAEDAHGNVVGYALTTITPLLYTNGRSAQLQELVVDHDVRGSGVGTALIEAVETVCRQRFVTQLTVASRRSADFYERLGYRSTADFLKKTFDY
jgi:N-acetylglutamate synthase-like GNAT family acetyltransferase